MRKSTNHGLLGRLPRQVRIALFSISLLIMPAVTAMGIWSASASAAPLPSPTVFAATSAYCTKGFFGLEPWYHFMPASELGYNGDPCAIHCFNFFVQNKHNPNECGETASDVPGVILAIIDDLLRIAALVAVAFIIIGSFQFVGSRGNSERTASAQSTVLNALIGLAIALVAVGFVSFIGNRLGG